MIRFAGISERHLVRSIDDGIPMARGYGCPTARIYQQRLADSVKAYRRLPNKSGPVGIALVHRLKSGRPIDLSPGNGQGSDAPRYDSDSQIFNPSLDRAVFGVLVSRMRVCRPAIANLRRGRCQACGSLSD